MSDTEMRKQARAERKKEMDRLMAQKPDKTMDDPKDVAEIQYAERNMGDYKLKSDPKYVVPEHQRVNAERKRRQMVLLQESVHLIKMGLNERFLAMRDLKRRIIKNIKKDNARLRELNTILGIHEDPFEPLVDPSEWPEDRYKFTKQDVEAFEKEQEKERARANAAQRSKFGGGGGGEESKEEKSAEPVAAPVSARTEAENKQAAELAAEDQHYRELLAAVPKSRIEESEELTQRKLFEYERNSLKEKINHAVTTFDDALGKLRREKFKLDADLKTTDLKILTLYQELHLLKDFEEKENQLNDRLRKARDQKAEVMTDIHECEKQLEQKLAEIKLWQEKDKAVQNEFHSLVSDKSEFYAQLRKIFLRKVKRSKKQANRDNEDEDEGDDSDADQEEEEESDADSDSDNDEDDDDSCPLNCDSSVYEKVLELREKRLEQEEKLAEYNKAVLELQRNYDRLQTKEKSIDTNLQQTEQEIEDFQSEKQKALNQIEVAIPLKITQLKFLIDSRLPAEITDALVFTSSGLRKLRRRIVELGNEKGQLQKQFRDLKKDVKSIAKDLQQRNELIAAERKKCEDVQRLKFGQIIDLSILEKVGEDDGAKELNARLHELEEMSIQKVIEWDRKLQDARDDLANITQENTAWLERVAQLTKTQYDLEDRLNSTTKSVHLADTTSADENAEAERQQLLQLVQLQEKEIDALKAEIHVLRRKGGHVYIPQA